MSIELYKVEDRKIKWKLNSLNGVDATIDRVTVTWPGNGKLKKVKFDGSDILKDVLLKSPATVDTWLKASKDRTLWAGERGKQLELELSTNFPKKRNQPVGDFDLEVTFEQGRSVTF